MTDGSAKSGDTAVITRDQAYAMLQALGQSKRTLKAAGCRWGDMKEADEGRVVITL